MADIKLSFGVDKLATAENFRQDLTSIINSIESKIPKLKISFEVDKEALGAFEKSSGEEAKRKFLTEDVTKYWQALTQVNNELSKMQANYEKWGNGGNVVGTEAYAKYGQEIEALKDLENSLKNGSETAQTFALRISRVKGNAADAAEEIKKMASAEKGIDTIAVDSNAYNSALSKMTKLLKTAVSAQNEFSAAKNGSGSKFYSSLTQDISAIDSLIVKLRSGELTEGEFKAQMDSLTQSVNRNVAGMRGATQINAAFSNQLKTMTGSFTGVNGGLTQYIAMMFSVYRVISLVVSGIKDLITKSIELENAMVDLRIVTGKTDETYVKYLQDISKVSSETATNLESLVTATTTYARLGFSIDESSNLAKFTGMLEKVGSIDAESAQKAITSIIKAFSSEVNANNIESVMDKLVTTGNKFPISVSQLAEGMLNASSALSAAGNSFSQSVALLTAANVTTQDASKSSTGLRTIAARIRNTTAELDALGEVMTTAKYEELVQTLTDHKVKLTEVNGEYRSTYDIIKDIAKQWNSMTSMEQAALATQIAGVRQQAVFFSLIEQFQEAEDSYKAMEDSAGSLSRAYGEYTNSTAAHIEQLQTSWKMLANDIFSSDTTKNVIDLGKGIVDIIDKMAQAKMLASAILGVLTAFKAMQFAASALKISSAVSGITKTLLTQKVVSESMILQTQQLTLSEQQYMLAQIRSAVARESLKKTEATAIAQRLGLIAATESLDTAEKGLSLTSATLNSVIAANPIGAIITGVVGLYSVLKILDSHLGITDKLSDWMAGIDSSVQTVTYNVEELSSNLDEAYNGYSTLRKETTGLIPRFAELAQGVDDLGQNVALTADDYSEFIEIQNKIAELFPELDNGLDSNGNHMLNLQYSASSLTDQLNALAEAERNVARQNVESSISGLFIAANAANGTARYDNSQYSDILSNVYKYAHTYTAAPAADQSFYQSKVNETLHDLAGIISEEDMQNLEKYAMSNVGKFDKLYEEVARRLVARTEAMESKFKAAQSEARNGLKDELSEWAQLTDEYGVISNKMGGSADSLISALIGDLDLSDVTSAADAFTMVEESVLKPLSEISDQAVEIISDMGDLSEQFASGEITAGEFSDSVDDLSKRLKNAGDDATILNRIMSRSKASEYTNKIKAITSAIKSGGDAAKKYIDSLSSEDITIAYNIVEANGSMSLDEFMSKVEAARLAGGDMINTLKFSEFFEDTKKVSGSIEKLTTAIDKLKSGTALTKNEMVKLAEQFPEMLKQSNLFTDGSIEGQKKLLEYTLKSYKDMYAAHVQSKISELEASREAITAQTKLETEKQQIIIQAEADAATGKINLAAAYTQAIGRINQLEAQNYVEYKDGEVLVNSKALEQQYNDTSDALSDAASNIWGAYASDVVKINQQMNLENNLALQRSLQQQIEDLQHYLDSDYIPRAAKDVMTRIQGGLQQEYLDNYTQFLLMSAGVDYNYGHRDSSDYDDTVSAALENAKEVVRQRLEMLAQADLETGNAIDNLRAIMDNLDTIFSTFKESSSSSSKSGSSGSSSSSSSDSDSQFSLEYKWKKHLVELEEMTQAEFLKWLRDNWYAAYERGEVSNDNFIKYSEEVYKGEKDLIENTKKTIDVIVEEVVKANKSIQEAEKKELQRRLSDLKDFYDEQKKLLKDQREQEKLDAKRAEKRKKIEELMLNIEDLSLDKSAAAQKKMIELQKDLKKAQDELEEFEKDQAVDIVTESLDKIYKQQSTEIENRIREIEDALNDPTAMYNIALNSIQENSEEIKQLLKDSGFIDNDAVKAWENAIKALKGFSEYFGEDYQGIVLTGYASGTRYSTKGYHRINENGSEMLFTSANGSQYRLFGTGDKVLDAGASEFLYALGESRGQSLINSAAAGVFGMTQGGATPAVVQMGDIIIQGNADERTVSEIRRAQKENVEMMLTAFKRMRR